MWHRNGEGIGGWDAGWKNFFLLMFRFRKVRSSKFSAAGVWQTDGPAPDALALLEGYKLCIRQAPFGAGEFLAAVVREPQILCDEQKTKNF